jgi:hypothetical protein
MGSPQFASLLTPSKKKRKYTSYGRSTITAVLIISALVYGLRGYSRRSPKEVDRIPFAESGITECDPIMLPLFYSADHVLADHVVQLLHPL